MKISFNNRVLSVVLVISVTFALVAIPTAAINFEDEVSLITSYFPTPTQAQIKELTDNDWAIINDMTRPGLVSFEHAYHILCIDKIVDKLEQHNQIVTSIDDEIVVLPAPDGINYLTNTETEFIIDALTKEMQKINNDKENLLSHEEALEILHAEMEKNPCEEIYIMSTD